MKRILALFDTHAMWMSFRQKLSLQVTVLTFSGLSMPAQASDVFPVRPIRLVVPVVPGGGADIVARLLADKMGKHLGTTVVVDNKAGGSGTIAALEVARAAPDGYTLMQCFVATHSTNPAVFKLRYDPIADFTPVGMMARTSNVLVVGPQGPQTFQQFMATARVKPGQLSYSSAGSGSATHLIMEYLENQAKVDLVHVPYKGAAPAMQDLLSGQVDAMFPSLTTALPHLRSGRLRALAGPRHNAMPCCPMCLPWPRWGSPASARFNGGGCARLHAHPPPWWRNSIRRSMPHWPCPRCGIA